MARELNVKMIDNLAKPDRRVEIVDRLAPGLRLVHQPSGHKSWAVRYNIDKRKVKRTLGDYPVITLAEARDMALAVRRDLAKGVNPKAADESKMTVAGAIASYRKLHVETLRDNTQKYLERELTALESACGARLLSSIKRSDILPLVDAAAKRGPCAKNQTIRTLIAFFNFCRNDRGWIETNPAQGTPKVKIASRERFLRDDELKKLWDAAVKANGQYGALVRLLILTGCRRNEIAHLEWSEVGEDYIHLSANRVKTAQPFDIAITPAMRKIFDSLPHKGRYVFGDGQRRLGTNGWAKQQIDVALQRDWSFHDLRHSFVTGLARIGVPIWVAEKCVNHQLTGILAVYQGYDFSREMREAWIKWSEHAEAAFPAIEATKAA